MKLAWAVIYNVIFYPIFFVVGCILCLFNSKFRQGVLGRFRSISQLKKYFMLIDPTKDIYWFHASLLAFLNPDGDEKLKSETQSGSTSLSPSNTGLTW